MAVRARLEKKIHAKRTVQTTLPTRAILHSLPPAPGVVRPRTLPSLSELLAGSAAEDANPEAEKPVDRKEARGAGAIDSKYTHPSTIHTSASSSASASGSGHVSAAAAQQQCAPTPPRPADVVPPHPQRRSPSHAGSDVAGLDTGAASPVNDAEPALASGVMNPFELTTFLNQAFQNIQSHRSLDLSLDAAFIERHFCEYSLQYRDVVNSTKINKLRKASIAEMCWLVVSLSHDPLKMDPELLWKQSQQSTKLIRVRNCPIDDADLERWVLPGVFVYLDMPAKVMQYLEFRVADSIFRSDSKLNRSARSSMKTSITAAAAQVPSAPVPAAVATTQSVTSAQFLSLIDTMETDPQIGYSAAPNLSGVPASRAIRYDTLTLAHEVFYWFREKARMKERWPWKYSDVTGDPTDEAKLRRYLEFTFTLKMDKQFEENGRDLILKSNLPIGARARFERMNPHLGGYISLDAVLESSLSEEELTRVNDQMSLPMLVTEKQHLERRRQYEQDLKERNDHIADCKKKEKEVPEATEGSNGIIDATSLARFGIVMTPATQDLWLLHSLDKWWRSSVDSSNLFTERFCVLWDDWGSNRTILSGQIQTEEARRDCDRDALMRLNVEFTKDDRPRYPLLVHLGDNAWFIHYHKHMWICPPRKNERNLILCLVLWFRIIQRDYANTLDDGRQLPKPLPFWKPERTRERKSASASASGSGSDTKAIYVRPSDAVRLARVNLARETSEQIRREHEQQRPRAPPIAAGDADVPRSASMDPIRSPSASVQPPLRAPPPAQQLT